ncbi:MAG: DnaB-like helicase C-terminal domain-containing protein [Armatimonadota bacterium]
MNIVTRPAPAAEDIGAELSAMVGPDGKPAQFPPIYATSELLNAWNTESHTAHHAYTTGQPRGPLTGFPSLDREIGGALWPGFHIVLGEPGTGKTAFSLQVAAQCQCPCLYVTCEMAPLELMRRTAARVTGTYLNKFKTGELAPAHSIELMQQAVSASPLLSIADATTVFAPPLWVQHQAAVLRGDGRHVLIIIDSLQSWAESSTACVQEYEALNMALQSIRHIAAALTCPVLVISEKNREKMNSDSQSAGAGTRKIEYGAETVFTLKHEGDTDKVTGKKQVNVILPKNRNGSVGSTIPLYFHGARQSFSEDGH